MIGAIIRARSNSSRLPKKILATWRDLTLIEVMVNRLKKSEEIDSIIIATTDSPLDDNFCRLLGEREIPYYRGSEEDVLGRVLKTAQHFSVDTIVDLTGDCPLLDPALIDKAVSFFKKQHVDYIANTSIAAYYPRGQDVQIYKTTTLEKVNQLTDDANDREHVSLYIYNNPHLFRLLPLPPLNFALKDNLRLTLDYPQDLELIIKILDNLGLYCSLEEINQFLISNPNVAAINSNLQTSYINDVSRYS